MRSKKPQTQNDVLRVISRTNKLQELHSMGSWAQFVKSFPMQLKAILQQTRIGLVKQVKRAAAPAPSRTDKLVTPESKPAAASAAKATAAAPAAKERAPSEESASVQQERPQNVGNQTVPNDEGDVEAEGT